MFPQIDTSIQKVDYQYTVISQDLDLFETPPLPVVPPEPGKKEVKVAKIKVIATVHAGDVLRITKWTRGAGEVQYFYGSFHGEKRDEEIGGWFRME
jgi:hypothetical protein